MCNTFSFIIDPTLHITTATIYTRQKKKKNSSLQSSRNKKCILILCTSYYMTISLYGNCLKPLLKNFKRKKNPSFHVRGGLLSSVSCQPWSRESLYNRFGWLITKIFSGLTPMKRRKAPVMVEYFIDIY